MSHIEAIGHQLAEAPKGYRADYIEVRLGENQWSPLGYKVESGKIVGRVKDTMVSGNVYQVLKQVEAIGSEARWVGGFLQAPPLYCPSLSVAAK